MRIVMVCIFGVMIGSGCQDSKDSEDTAVSSAIDINGDDTDSADRFVMFETSMGDFQVELFVEQAPITTENFLRYVDEGFYDGQDGLGATLFHRVVADFVVQGGGFTTSELTGESGSGPLNYIEKQTHAEIVNEALSSGLSNTRGTLAMARTDVPDSATSQFYINLVDNVFLDAGEMTEAGYAVFGTVTSGMDVFDNIATVSTNANDAPLEDVIIENVRRGM